MGERKKPNYHGRLLLRELQKLRIQVGLKQTDAAGKLRISNQKVSRFENGQIPTWLELHALLDIYGVVTSDYGYYEDLWEHAMEPGWWREYCIKDYGYVSLEHEAKIVRVFNPSSIPGLFQTKQYARTSFERSALALSKDTIETQVAVRMRRQERLTSSENRLILHAVIHESALYTGVDKAQIRRLIERAELPNVTLQIIPQSHGLYSGQLGSLTLLTFPDKEEPDLAHVEHHLGMTQSQDPEEVAAVRLAFDDVVKAAMSPADSLAFLRRLIA